MNRETLLARLDRASIDPRSYDLSGSGRPESYVMRCRGEEWQVFYSERGLKTGLRSFDNESEANLYFFALVTADPTSRRA